MSTTIDQIHAQLDQLESTREPKMLTEAPPSSPSTLLHTFVNGQEISTNVEPEETLLEFLRGGDLVQTFNLVLTKNQPHVNPRFLL